MTRIFFISLFYLACLATPALAKGGSGVYYIKGTAFTGGKVVLKNADLTVQIGGITKTIKTNDKGQFEIEVPWESACPSGRTVRQNKRDNQKLNPQFINLKYLDKEIKIENEWRKYGNLFPASNDEVTWKRDLHFA
jgi:hypothetical protein